MCPQGCVKIIYFSVSDRHERVITNAVNMDSNVGLDYIVDNPDYCNKLASGKLYTRILADKSTHRRNSVFPSPIYFPLSPPEIYTPQLPEL